MTATVRQLKQKITFLEQGTRQLEITNARLARKLKEYELAEAKRIRKVVKETPQNDAWRSIL